MRARNIKPSIFKNEFLAVEDPLYTLIFAGLWCAADREGRLEDRPGKLHLDINPGRAFEGTERALIWLDEHDFIRRYSVDGRNYIQILTFKVHQKPHLNEKPSTIPPPQSTTKEPSDPLKSTISSTTKAPSHPPNYNQDLAPRHEVSTTKEPSETDQGDKHLALNPSCLNPSSLNPDSVPDQPRYEKGKEPESEPAAKAKRPLILHDSLPKDAWAEWLEHRRRKRWPIDDTTLRKQLNLLEQFSAEQQREMIDTSIQANWQGLFPPKGGGSKASPIASLPPELRNAN